MIIDALGHLFYAIVFTGSWLLSHRHSKFGWVLRAIGHAGWIYLGFQVGLTSIWMWETFMLVNDLYGFWKWRQDEKERT